MPAVQAANKARPEDLRGTGARACFWGKNGGKNGVRNRFVGRPFAVIDSIPGGTLEFPWS
jgi:hypothetical protein